MQLPTHRSAKTAQGLPAGVLRAARIFFPLVAAMLSAMPSHAQSANKEIEALENRLCTATGHRLATVSEDFIQVGAAGELDDKEAEFPTLTSPVPPRCRDISIVVRDDAALATGITIGTPTVRFLHVWSRERNQWILALAHLTPIVRAPDGPLPAGPITATVWPTGETPDERAILETQRALNETFAAYDAKAYEQLTARDFVRVTIDGTTMSRDEFIAAAGDRAGAPRRDPNHSEFRVRVYKSVATLIYFNLAADQQRVTRVFVREGGIWKQLHTQATRVLGTK